MLSCSRHFLCILDVSAAWPGLPGAGALLTPLWLQTPVLARFMNTTFHPALVTLPLLKVNLTTLEQACPPSAEPWPLDLMETLVWPCPLVGWLGRRSLSRGSLGT